MWLSIWGIPIQLQRNKKILQVHSIVDTEVLGHLYNFSGTLDRSSRYILICNAVSIPLMQLESWLSISCICAHLPTLHSVTKAPLLRCLFDKLL